MTPNPSITTGPQATVGRVGTSVLLASEFAKVAHAGQFRRDGVTPYITHPEAVANMLRGESDEVLATAWLHDVVEDCGATHATLAAAGIPQRVIEAVMTLTKGCESYPDYLEFVAANELTRKVKIADMLHNLSSAPSEQQKAKYTHGILFLANTKL